MNVDLLIEKGLAQDVHYIFFKKNGSYIINSIDRWCLYTYQKVKKKEIKFHREWCLFLSVIGLIFKLNEMFFTFNFIWLHPPVTISLERKSMFIHNLISRLMNGVFGYRFYQPVLEGSRKISSN